MTEKNLCFKVTFKDFAGRTVVRYWKERSRGAILVKLTEITTFSTLEKIDVLPPDQYAVESKAARSGKKPRWITNRKEGR